MGGTTPTINWDKYVADATPQQSRKIDFSKYETTAPVNDFQQHLDDLVSLKKLGYAGPSYLDQMIHAAGGELAGAAKSVGQVPATISKGLNKIPGIGETLAPSEGVQEFDRMTTPQGTAEKVGAGIETAAEMAAGEGIVKNALLKIPGLAKYAPFVKIASSASAGGGTAAAHGESPLLPAVAGGVGSAAAEAAPAGAEMLEKSAVKNYEAVLNPTKQAAKYDTEKIMPQLLQERPIAGSRAGLAEKAASNAESAGQEIEQHVSGMHGQMNMQPILDGLQNLKKGFQVNGVSLRPEVDSAIDDATTRLSAMSQPGQGPGWWNAKTLDYQNVIKARRILDQAVSEAKGYQGGAISDASLTNVRKTAANSIRNELAKADPDLAALNQKFHFWNTLSDVMDQTIQRKTGQAPSLASRLEPIAGAAMGGAQGAGALYFLGKAFRSTAWQTTSAATKSAIADALANQKFDKALDVMKKAGFATTIGLQEAQ